MLNRKLIKHPQQLAAISITAALALLCLWLLIAIIMQTTSDTDTQSYGESAIGPANLNWNWFADDVSVADIDKVSQVISDQLANANINATLLGGDVSDASSATLKVNNSPEAVYQRKAMTWALTV